MEEVRGEARQEVEWRALVGVDHSFMVSFVPVVLVHWGYCQCRDFAALFAVVWLFCFLRDIVDCP